jgi:hypothetical protein
MGIRGQRLFLKLQRLQNKVLRTIGDLPRRTPTRDLHVAFKIWYKNYAASRQKSYLIVTMSVLAALAKERRDIERTKGLRLTAVRPTTVVLAQSAVQNLDCRPKRMK